MRVKPIFRSILDVGLVACNSLNRLISKTMKELTRARSHTSVKCVIRVLRAMLPFGITDEFTQGKVTGFGQGMSTFLLIIF